MLLLLCLTTSHSHCHVLGAANKLPRAQAPALSRPLAEHFCPLPARAGADADDATMAALLGEAPQPGAEVKPEEEDTAQGGGGGAGSEAAARVKEEAGAGVKPEAMEVDGVAPGRSEQPPAEQQGAALPASGSSAALVKEEQPQDGAQPPAPHAQQAAAAGLPPRPPSPAQQQQQQQQRGPAGKPPLHPAVARLAKADSMQPSSAGVSQSGAEAGGTETEAGTTVEQQEAQPLHPVSKGR